jgi:hypothetical protein
MLYEPPKTKKYILIGAAAIALAILVIAAFSVFNKNKTIQTSENNLLLMKKKLQQEKIQKQSQKLDQIKENSGIKDYTPEEIDQQSKKLDELRNQMIK